MAYKHSDQVTHHTALSARTIAWLRSVILLLMVSPVVLATDQAPADYQIKLEQIREKITQVLNRLNETENKRSNVRSQIQSLELKIAKTSKSLRETQLKHKKSTRKLAALKDELKKLKQKLRNQRAILADQIRSAYAMGQQAQVKLLLNQQQPDEMGRAMVYYDYLNQARTEEIGEYLQSIEKKQQLETSIGETAAELEQLLDKRLKQKKSLSGQRINRKRLLAKLSQDIDHQQNTLTELKGSRNRIEQLLMSLGELLADIPSAPLDQKPFGQLKGKLPWPIKGNFNAKFGTSRNQGDLTWNGVIISSSYGTPVRAISHGRVAFADWLQGYGFITIIDHKDGYMSLYGYNQALYKQAGDWIEAGEVIATVGDSGGQADSGLYFEIRHLGKPINPNRWCSSKIKHLAMKEN
ncbi:MAG: peptidoglycan DD-metalloendopeptidase family protein [Gammaproteobacteria bacterium]|nr:peptidoglycan DD-metalloendopeptidase family protein [Gammaproteobacteria bacterium]